VGVKRTRVRVQIEAVAQLREAPVCADRADQMEIQSRTARKSGVGLRSRTLAARCLSVWLVCAGFPAVSIPCVAQGNLQAEQSSAPATSQETSTKPGAEPDQQPAAPAKAEEPPKKKKKPARGAIVVAPLPISSPAIGSGIVPVLGYIFPFSTKDKVSPPSTIGAAGLITDNGSRGFAVGGQLFFKENT
jgi:hypothetical protein